MGFLFGVASRMLVCLTLIVLLNRRMRWHRSARLTYLVAGIRLWGAMISAYWSAQFIPSGLISVLFGLNPVVTGLMATIWLSERVLTPFRITGLGLGLAGLSVVFAHGLETDADAALGIAGVLLSVHIHAATAVWVKRIGAGIPALETTTGTLLVAVPLFLDELGDARRPVAAGAGTSDYLGHRLSRSGRFGARIRSLLLCTAPRRGKPGSADHARDAGDCPIPGPGDKRRGHRPTSTDGNSDHPGRARLLPLGRPLVRAPCLIRSRRLHRRRVALRRV